MHKALSTSTDRLLLNKEQRAYPKFVLQLLSRPHLAIGPLDGQRVLLRHAGHAVHLGDLGVEHNAAAQLHHQLGQLLDKGDEAQVVALRVDDLAEGGGGGLRGNMSG